MLVQDVPKVSQKVSPKYFLYNSINLIICSYNTIVLSLKFCFIYIHFQINVCFHTYIRIKTVSIMAKFESPAIVQQKLEAEFCKDAPKEDCVIATFQRSCETGTLENRERSGRPSKITEEKFDKVYDVIENQQQTSIQTVVMVCSISRTTPYRIMTK